ncbi:MAG: GNAT family N-acetyltransferase [Thermoprotei archaeon]|jgi:ribosomal protein S18 acetylase RimI-like enzyme
MIIIKEVDDSKIDDVIKLDRELSWELLDDKVKKELNWNEFAKRHKYMFRKLYNTSIGQQIILGAFDNNNLIGYAWIELRLDTISMLPTCFIVDIGIKQEYRGKRIGANLMNEIIKIALNNNVRTINLLVEKKNTKAINFYKKFDFKITGYIMEKQLKKT